MIVSITIRINVNSDNILSICRNPEDKEQGTQNKFWFGILSAVVALGISLLFTEDFIPVISFIVSLLCPYFMIIAPGDLTSSAEHPT